LAKDFTVHIMERRGRGRSGPQGDDYGIDRECDDLIALQAVTGATLLVGHSFGGLIALETARDNPVFESIAIYEPGVSIDGSIPMGWIPPYEELLDRQRHLDAFAVFSKGTGPDKGRRTPLWLMKLMLPLFVSPDRRSKMFTLLQQNALEHRAVGACDNHLASYSAIQARVLVMRGGRSGSDWVKLSTTRLAEILSRAESQEFAALDHFGIDQGDPESVAATTARFFLT
jgi:pimeloyl-ACP methyl ester carboxylesterase